MTANTLTTEPRPTAGRRPTLTLVKRPSKSAAPPQDNGQVVPVPPSVQPVRIHISGEMTWEAIRRHPDLLRAPDGTVVEPACFTWIRPTERLALILLHLDPRLNQLIHRERLRLLVGIIDPTISVFWLGDSVARLRQLHAGGYLDTLAFVDKGKDDPALDDCIGVLGMFARLGQWSLEPDSDYRMTRALCLLGHIVHRTNPAIAAALA